MINFFRIRPDSVGKMRKQVDRKRYEREYVLSNIVELKDTVEVLSESMLTLTHDVSILIKLHERLIGEIRAQNDILTEIITNSGNNLDEIDKEKYDALVNSLKSSTDGLLNEMKSVDVKKEK